MSTTKITVGWLLTVWADAAVVVSPTDVRASTTAAANDVRFKRGPLRASCEMGSSSHLTSGDSGRIVILETAGGRTGEAIMTSLGKDSLGRMAGGNVTAWQ